ncbi:MAG: hypothetical protein PVS3B1_06910 [Ktedonobacteraceae bacterium]
MPCMSAWSRWPVTQYVGSSLRANMISSLPCNDATNRVNALCTSFSEWVDFEQTTGREE